VHAVYFSAHQLDFLLQVYPADETETLYRLGDEELLFVFVVSTATGDVLRLVAYTDAPDKFVFFVPVAGMHSVLVVAARTVDHAKEALKRVSFSGVSSRIE